MLNEKPILEAEKLSIALGILISGHGSNLQALIDACNDDNFPANIAIVISNNFNAYGLKRAAKANIPNVVLNHTRFVRREQYDGALAETLEGAGVELICLAGFMRVLSKTFVDRWKNRIINVHPSLLPAFKGLNVHERVIDAGVRFSGCTVHYVRAELDSGPIIIQSAVPVSFNDTRDTFSAKVLETEHRCYPLAVRLIAERRINMKADSLIIKGVGIPDNTMINPNSS